MEYLYILIHHKRMTLRNKTTSIFRKRSDCREERVDRDRHQETNKES